FWSLTRGTQGRQKLTSLCSFWCLSSLHSPSRTVKYKTTVTTMRVCSHPRHSRMAMCRQGSHNDNNLPRGAAVKYKNLVSVVCLGLALSCAQQAAQARGIAIDFSPSVRGNNFGSDPADSGVLELTNDGSSGAIDLGFTLDWGGGPVSSIFINENGIVS